MKRQILAHARSKRGGGERDLGVEGGEREGAR